MTREEIKNTPELIDFLLDESVLANSRTKVRKRLEEVCNLAITALEQQPCDEVVSRQAALNNLIDNTNLEGYDLAEALDAIDNKEKLPAVTQKLGKCKDCKWWRDSDGAYRRGVKAESRCPINTVSVANGWGYCYMFKPQKSEEV